jgi:hypothetical protein
VAATRGEKHACQRLQDGGPLAVLTGATNFSAVSLVWGIVIGMVACWILYRGKQKGQGSSS